MCGILFAYGPAEHDITEYLLPLKHAIAPRGPDHKDSITVANRGHLLHFHSSVLHLRGESVAKQPFHEDGDVLAYNGEIFDGLAVEPHENDGQKLFQSLRRDPISAIQRAEGPYAFVYSDANSIFWGRDPLGRRSLLIREPDEERSCLLIASLAPERSSRLQGWAEVPADAVYRLDLLTGIRQVYKRQYPSTMLDKASLCYQYEPISEVLPDIDELLQCDEDGAPVVSHLARDALSGLRVVLEESICKRVSDVPRLKGPPYPKARVGVLFSGGLDCTVLALLADEFITADESIDLLNVAFENPRAVANAAKQRTSDPFETYNTPDRLTGIASYKELCKLRPHRKWNMVQIDVPYAEFLESRDHIVDLMYPNNTVMDLSIAQALYFAARGRGSLAGEPAVQYLSEARVLLSGLGADEQLGGYSRHKKAFASNGWPGLIEELQMDLDRIGSRNLGRDDRIISSLGKEVRYPYLATSVIAYLASLPVHLKVDYKFGDGIGDKMLLRMLAREAGLEAAARFAKRAIQFGARSAKMELDSRGSKGTSVLM